MLYKQFQKDDLARKTNSVSNRRPAARSEAKPDLCGYEEQFDNTTNMWIYGSFPHISAEECEQA